MSTVNATRSLRLSIVAAALAALALPPPAAAEICIGRLCGRERGYPIEHCHVKPNDTDPNAVCWDSEISFACEQMGYEINVACPQPTITGGVAGQQLDTIGGFGTFLSSIRELATPKILAPPPPPPGDDEEEGKRGVVISEIASFAELESWKLDGAGGDTMGLRVEWSREGETGRLLGAHGSFQRAEPDAGGGTTDLAMASFDVGHTLGSAWKWAVNGSVGSLGGDEDLTLLGGGAMLAFSVPRDDGIVWSGGALYRLTTFDGDALDDTHAVGAGVAAGFPIGERLALDVDLYAVDVLAPEPLEDFFYTAGLQVSVATSPRFAFTVGARTLQGIDRVDSTTFTLGLSARWD